MSLAKLRARNEISGAIGPVEAPHSAARDDAGVAALRQGSRGGRGRRRAAMWGCIGRPDAPVISLRALTLLAAERYPDLERRLSDAEAPSATDRLDRRDIEDLSEPSDGGSLANLLTLLHRTGYWNDAHVLLRHRSDIEPKANQTTTATPVLTVPTGVRVALPANVGREFESTLAATRRIIRSATRRIVIIAAYAHPTAADVLGAELGAATRRGVRVTFITQAQTESYDPHPTMARLAEVIEMKGNPRLLSLKLAALGAERTMHAKIILVDDETVLVGSANFTGTALTENIEAGFVVSGPPAASYARLIRTLEEVENVR